MRPRLWLLTTLWKLTRRQHASERSGWPGTLLSGSWHQGACWRPAAFRPGLQKRHGKAFTLSYPDVEELLAERGLEVSYETVRRWVLKFGPAFARNLRRLRPRASDT